jgi:hypothetical protein
MLVIRVELHSAITGKVTEIARMLMWNDGTGTPASGNYEATVAGGDVVGHMRPIDIRYPAILLCKGKISGYPRKLPVWNLVARMLAAMEFK